MRQLNSDEVLALQDEQAVYIKLSRLNYPTPSDQYEGPATLYVRRHPYATRSTGLALIHDTI